MGCPLLLLECRLIQEIPYLQEGRMAIRPYTGGKLRLVKTPIVRFLN